MPETHTIDDTIFEYLLTEVNIKPQPKSEEKPIPKFKEKQEEFIAEHKPEELKVEVVE